MAHFRGSRPNVEVGRMNRAYIDRQASIVEADRYQHAAIRGVARLALTQRESTDDGGPDHDHRAGPLQFRADQRVELVTGRDFRVPPHRPALRLQRRTQGRDSRLIVRE